MADRFRLHNRVAVITGASRGIGRAIALGFAEAGAHLVLASRTAADLERVAEEARALGHQALAVPTDVSLSDQVQRLVDAALSAFGRIDVLVNNAGISPIYKRAELVTEAEWDQILAVNLKGLFLCCQAVGRVMIEQRRGKIINMASVGAQVGLPRLVAYCAAKGAIQQVTRVLALEWAQYNIQVNALAPGYVETELTRSLRENERLRQMLLEQIPVGRFAQPDDVVGAALLLASDASDYITGHTLLVDGGWTAR